MKILYVSFYTPNYRAYAAELRSCLVRLALWHDLEEVPCQGGFLQNVRYKPTFILRKMEEHPEAGAVVWVDADALINRVPVLFEKITRDFAVHFMKLPGKRTGSELLSGTVFIRNTEKCRGMMREWIAALAADKSPRLLKPEQQVLQRILPKLGITVQTLPRDYCWIVRPHDTAIPTIEHHQASRESRYLKAGVFLRPRRTVRNVDDKTRIRHPRRAVRGARKHGKVSHRRSSVVHPYGGVKGKMISRGDIGRVHDDIKAVPHASELDGAHPGSAILILGTSPSANHVAPAAMARHLCLSRELMVQNQRIDYIVIDSRQRFWEYNQGRAIVKLTTAGSSVLVARHVFDPAICLVGDRANPADLAQPVPQWDCYVYTAQTGKSGERNVTSLSRPVPSYGCELGGLLQIAVILGAGRLELIGMELGSDQLPHYTQKGLTALRAELALRKIEVVNWCASEQDMLCQFFPIAGRE